jgi:hypothetical protein
MIFLNLDYRNGTTKKYDKWFNYTNSEKYAKITFAQIKFLYAYICGINRVFFNVILVLTKVNLLKKIPNFRELIFKGDYRT